MSATPLNDLNITFPDLVQQVKQFSLNFHQQKQIRTKSDLQMFYVSDPFLVEVTFIANATVVVSSFAVLLQVVRHVGCSQKLAADFAGNFVFVAGEV